MIQSALIAIAEKMKSDFNSSRLYNHAVLKGESRERTVINEYLKKYLPPKYGLTSGLVIDSFGNSSKQQDIIIYDRLNTMPLFSDSMELESQNCVPIENVFAIIEVKSTLNSSTISDAFDKYKSVCDLIPIPQDLNPVISVKTGFPAPAGFCFSFTSDWDIKRIAKEIHDLRIRKDHPKHISAFCVLGKGVVHYGSVSNILEINVSPISTGSSEVYMEEEQDGDSIVRLTWIINSTLNQIVLGKPNLTNYLEHSSSTFNKKICVSPEIMDDGMQMIYEGNVIHIPELSKLMRQFGMIEKVNSIGLFDFLTDNLLATRIILTYFFYFKIAEYTSDKLGNASFDITSVETLINSHSEEFKTRDFMFSDDELLDLRVKSFNSSVNSKVDKDVVAKLIESLRKNKDFFISMQKKLLNNQQ